MENIHQQFLRGLSSTVGDLTSEEMEEIISQTVIRKISAKERIIKEGEVVRKMYFLCKGAVRYYHYYDGIEKTIWFSFEDSFVTSFYSYIAAQPSKESVEALEDCVLLEFSKEQLTRLIAKYAAVNTAYIKVLEDTVMKKELALQRDYYTAAERYENLLSNFPHIVQRVSLGIIASYIGVNQSTLSRIRKQ
jgi:CRP-like cAMP-binding protein